MTTKKLKGSKTESRNKKRSQNTSAASSVNAEDKNANSETALQMSTDELFPEIGDGTVSVEPIMDSVIFIDEPTLTEIIIETYEGEKLNGRFEGLGKAYFVNGNIYEGMFSEGAMHGTGKFYWKSEDITYEGDLYYNVITGKGKYVWADGSSYEGEIVRGIRNGRGIYRNRSGLMYSGLWNNGKRHGIGLMNYDIEGKSFYEGEWNQNTIEGVGFRQYRSGNTYEGEWYQGKRHGHGTMKWLDRNEEYIGQWKHGIQHGSGLHVWFVQRIKGSQYSLRNVYEGNFVNSKRHGYGSFTYPSGARYEGQWVNNKKCGMGEFIFKNGRNYKGIFEDDRVKEFPAVSLSGRDFPDLNLKKTQQWMLNDVENVSARLSVSSANTFSPSFQLYLDHILMDPRILNPEEESIQIQKSVLSHLGPIRKIYQFYSTLGDNVSVDNTSEMNQMQFCRFLKDCRLHHNPGSSISEIDRALAESLISDPSYVSQNPANKVLFLSFINNLISIAYFVYADDYSDYEDVYGNLLTKCFGDLMNKNVLPFSCKVGGILYSDSRKTGIALNYFYNLYSIYKEFSYPKNNYPHYFSMKMRDFLIIMKKLNLISTNLTATEIVHILSLDDPNVTDGQFVSLETELSFYEFFEAMISCAAVFVTKEIIDFYLKPEEKQALSMNVTAPSEYMEDSETEFTLTVSVTGDSNKLEEDEKNNTKSQGKPQSGNKNKVSSADSNNSKNRKADTEKTSVAKKPVKSVKSPKATNSRGRKQSVEKDQIHVRKASTAVSEVEKVTVSECNVKDDESSAESSNPVKAQFPEMELPEAKEEILFSMWTHQLLIFFTQYLFPAATKYFSISRIIEDKQPVDDSGMTISPSRELSPDLKMQSGEIPA